MIDSNNLTDDQLNQLAAQKLAQKNSSSSQVMSDEQIDQLAAQKLAEKQMLQSQIDNTQEASLGFANRSLYSLEPLQSNRMALLQREFPGKVQEINGEPYINENGKLLPVNKKGLSFGDAAEFAGALPEAAGGVVGKVAGAVGGMGALSIPAAAGLGAVGGLVGSEFRRGLANTLGVPQVADEKEILANQALSAVTGATLGGAAQLVNPYMPAIKNVTGQVVGGATKGVGKLLNSIPGSELAKDASFSVAKKIGGTGERLATYAEEKALKAAGATKGDFKKLFGDKANELGRTVLEKKIISPGDTIADVVNKATEAKNLTGQKIGQIYEAADNLKNTRKIDIGKIVLEHLEEAESKYKGKAGYSKIIGEIQNLKDELVVNGEVGFKKAQEIRQSIDDAIPWNSTKTDSAVAAEKKSIRNKIQTEIHSAISEADQNGKLSKELLNANKEYGQLKTIEKMAIAKASGENANRSIGLSEQIAGAAGMAAKGPIAGIASAVGSKLTKKYADPIVATTVDKVSKILQSNPKALGDFAETLASSASVSPNNLAITVRQLIGNPDFTQMMEVASSPNRPQLKRAPSAKFTRSNQ